MIHENLVTFLNVNLELNRVSDMMLIQWGSSFLRWQYLKLTRHCRRFIRKQTLQFMERISIKTRQWLISKSLEVLESSQQLLHA